MSPILRPSLLALAAVLAMPAPALQAQQTEADAESQPDTEAEAEEDDFTIVVQGSRVRGQLIIDQPPLAEYDEQDIAAFGASSIEDVLAAIEPATGSAARGSRGGGRPVFLINGIRVSSFREFRSYPPEAISKIEVFPEEVAQRFGYSADQRVVNIVLKPNFQSVTAEVEYEQPDRGGFSRNEQEATYLRIGEQGRLNFNLELEDTSLLTEAERGLTINGSAVEAPFRSLIADSMGIEAEANYARSFMDTGTSLSLNGTYERSENRSLSGLSTDGIVPLERRSRSNTFSAGGTVNQPFGGWTATFTTDAVRALGETEIDRREGSGFDIARNNTWSIDNKATFVGYPVELPAGELATTFDVGLDWRRIESQDTRTADDLSLTRRRLDGGVNLAVPVAERDGFLGVIGDVGLNFSAGLEDLSDFGTLYDWTAGVNWSPFENLRLSATRIFREVAPSLTNLGSPRIDEFNAPVFDYASGQTELVTLITGGNPDLLAETQRDWQFSANWELPFWEDTRLQADYGINRSRNVTATPSFSAAFEQAFPDRVTRDAGGDLLAIDRRPLTLFQTRSRVLSFGINTRGSIGPEPERGDGGERRDRGAADNGERGARAGGGRMGGAFDPAQMEAIRGAFCNAPEGEMPDLSQIPERFRARLLDENGNPDPERIAAARERFCGAEAEQRSERFAALRTALCADPPQLDGLPEQVLERLRGEDGEIDQEKLAALRERLCSADGGAQANAEQGGRGRGRGGPRNPFQREDRDTRARYFVSLNHNITLENEVLLSQSGPLFNQLDGELLGSGAIPRHSARLEGGIFWQGYGVRLSGNYIGEAVVRGGDAPGASDLFYGDLATFDLRLFANLDEVFDSDEGWMEGLRVSLRADNIFDARRTVVDGTGAVPDAFAPFRIDPTGRYLGVDIRKAF